MLVISFSLSLVDDMITEQLVSPPPPLLCRGDLAGSSLTRRDFGTRQDSDRLLHLAFAPRTRGPSRRVMCCSCSSCYGLLLRRRRLPHPHLLGHAMSSSASGTHRAPVRMNERNRRSMEPGGSERQIASVVRAIAGFPNMCRTTNGNTGRSIEVRRTRTCELVSESKYRVQLNLILLYRATR